MANKRRHELSTEDLELARYKGRIARNKSYKNLSVEQREQLRIYNRNRYQQNKEYIREQLRLAKIKRKAKDPVRYNTLRKILRYKRNEPNTPEVKDAIIKMFEIWGKNCLSCGCDKDVTIDHINPISKGGITELNNLQPLCRSCNASKGVNVIDYRPSTTKPYSVE